jgi:hypothetical protein
VRTRVRKPLNYRTILQVSSDSKTVKGEKFGYLTGIMYLAPADLSGVINVCPKAGNCKVGCLNKAGRGIFDSTQQARIRKTRYMVEQPEAFIASLRYDIAALERKAERLGLIPCVRVNGTSDLPKLARQMAGEFPTVQFYDYTKIPRPWQRTLPNYHLTFSLDGMDSNLTDTLDALKHGVNAAVVFDTRKGQSLPTTWMGYRVIDGDLSDLRFHDTAGVVVGLRAKGLARKDTSGFVQIAVGAN